MTPLQIQMMLHYHCSPEPYSVHNRTHAQSEVVHRQRQQLLDDGMLSVEGHTDSGYTVTDKGRFYIEYLLSVPVPSTKFVIEFPLPF